MYGFSPRYFDRASTVAEHVRRQAAELNQVVIKYEQLDLRFSKVRAMHLDDVRVEINKKRA